MVYIRDLRQNVNLFVSAYFLSLPICLLKQLIPPPLNRKQYLFSSTTSKPHITFYIQTHAWTICYGAPLSFTIWKAKISLVIFLALLTLLPSSSSTSTSAAMVENPSYSTWYYQDKLNLSSLISSLSQNISTHVVGLQTSSEVWVTLERMFASQSKAHVMHSPINLQR